MRALERWLRPRRPVLETIALRGTWLDETDVQELLRQSLPGIDELAALLEILRYGRSPAYDVIVVDTAPTGHTLRMLAMPDALRAVALAFDHMQAKHRAMVEALRGATIEDEADEMIRDLQEDAQALTTLLRDPELTDVTLVSLPEKLAVEETLDAARSLLSMRIPIAAVVMNRLTAPPPQKCDWCDGRRSIERQAISSLARGLASVARISRSALPRLAIVGARQTEPTGVRALRGVAADLRKPATLPRRPLAAGRPARRRIAALPATFQQPAQLAAVKLLMFGGKGGVGKTTCAAASALHLAETQPKRRFLIVSADPAHSLADVLEARVGDPPRRVAGLGNLDVRELDPAGALKPIRTRYTASVDKMFDRILRGSAIDVTHDRRVMRDLLDFAPPGLDELAAVLELVDLLGDARSPRRYDVIVMDTAPTGHAVRLLQMPETVQDWTKALMRILLKYQPLAGLGDLGAALLQLSRGLGRLRAMLANPMEVQLVVVTRAAALPRHETARLLGTLRRLEISVPAVIVNAVGGGDCTRCRASTRQELRETESLIRLARARSGQVAVIGAPAAVPPPAGVRALGAWRRRWRAL